MVLELTGNDGDAIYQGVTGQGMRAEPRFLQALQIFNDQIDALLV